MRLLIEDLRVAYADHDARRGERLVLDGLSMSVPDATHVGILGPSGSGKTTLLMAMADLLAGSGATVTAKEFLIDGIRPEVLRAKHTAAFVFQRPIFFEWLS